MVAPFTKDATCTGNPSAGPRTARSAARITTAGAAAEAVSATAAAVSAADSATPRRASCCWSSFLARHSCTATVPGSQPSAAAASSRLRPSRTQRVNAARYFAGSRCTSSSSTACNSRRAGSQGDSTSAARAARCSWVCRRAMVRFARRAMRRAVPCSQLASDSGRRTCAACRASTRNVAWNTSSASCSCPRLRRATDQTRAAWRRNSASKAPSSRSRTKRPSSCASVSSPRCVALDSSRSTRSRVEWTMGSALNGGWNEPCTP